MFIGSDFVLSFSFWLLACELLEKSGCNRSSPRGLLCMLVGLEITVKLPFPLLLGGGSHPKVYIIVISKGFLSFSPGA